MTTIFEEEDFDGFQDRDSGTLFSDLEFRHCSFTSCSVSRTREPQKRSTVRGVRFLDCKLAGCFLGPAVIEDVLVDGLQISKRLISQGAVFKHVVLKGKIDRLILGPVLPPLYAQKEYQQQMKEQFEKVNAEYYRTADWALDISEAEFSDFDVRGIPSRLVRRDPFTQAVVKREKAISGEWKKLDLSGTWWSVSLDMLAKSSWEDGVLVAPKRHRQFNQALKGLFILRKAGIVEPD